VDPAPRPKRRTFTAQYKRAIVAEYEHAPNGHKGAVLRREGLYSSYVIEWARARDAGVLRVGPDPGDRAGPGPSGSAKRRSVQERENEQLRRENARMAAELAKTRMALDIMGKAHALWETISEGADNDRWSRKP
jgi:transposase-like protein